jgi:hypothetical protein
MNLLIRMKMKLRLCRNRAYKNFIFFVVFSHISHKILIFRPLGVTEQVTERDWR